MSNDLITTQLRKEIADLEQELGQIDQKRKQLKSKIKTHQKALKLIDPPSATQDANQQE